MPRLVADGFGQLVGARVPSRVLPPSPEGQTDLVVLPGQEAPVETRVGGRLPADETWGDEGGPPSTSVALGEHQIDDMAAHSELRRRKILQRPEGHPDREGHDISGLDLSGHAGLQTELALVAAP